MMWPFNCRREKPRSRVKQTMERLVAGFVIGAAVSSILGKKLVDEDEDEEDGGEGDEEV